MKKKPKNIKNKLDRLHKEEEKVHGKTEKLYHKDEKIHEKIKKEDKKTDPKKKKKKKQSKIGIVMHEFKEGKLKSGSGQTVTNPKQAIAIGISESRRKKK